MPRRSLVAVAAVGLVVAATASACARSPERARSAPAAGPTVDTRPSSARAAKVHPLAPGQELGGPNATGKPGDWVLENDEVVFVVDGLGGGAGFAESGGNVVDAADARARRDELGQVFTYFGAFPRQGVYSSLDARVEPDGVAVVEARGAELYEPAIEVVTQYRLAPGARGLRMRTTLTNRGGTKVGGLGLGDAIQWGGCEKIAPGKPVGFKGRSSGRFVGAVGRVASYAIAQPNGADFGAISGSTWTDTEQSKDVELEPSGSVTYERVFYVGERPDVASIVAELDRAAARELGAIEIRLTDPRGGAVRVPVGAKAVLGTEDAPDLLTIVATSEGDALSGAVPPGKWLVGFAPSAGRRGEGARAAVEVKPGASSPVMLAVTDAASVKLGPCESPAPRGALPCKLTIEGLDGTASPTLGPSHVAGLAKNVVTLRPGEAREVPLPHGRYRVTASRGPEYDIATAELTVPGPGPAAFTLRRVVDTSGYLASDFHQHSVASADAPVAVRDRVLANAAEGVEVAVASEHNVVTDLAPVVKELGLSSFLVQIPGDEITSDASKKPFGHANVFPFPPRPGEPRAGAPAARDRLASEVFAEARAVPGGPRVLQINHPRSGSNGYFDQLGFDPAKGTGTGAGYEASFDAIEVWNGRVVAHRTKVLEDYMALLRTSHPVTPIADTDTHGIVGEEPGYPRTYVRVAHPAGDAALEAWDDARSQDLVKTIREARDVVLTNGPFVRVTANGAPIGGVTRPRAGVVDVKVSVTTAPWIVVDRAEVRLARGGAERASAPAPLRPTRGPTGALVAAASFALRVREDDAFIVIVSGTKPMRPILSGEDSEISPWAMSGPIWIDADGDGVALGRQR